MRLRASLLIACIAVILILSVHAVGRTSAQSGTWYPLAVPDEWYGDYFADLDMTSSSEGWAAGNRGIMRYQDGAWSVVTETDRLKGGFLALDMLSATDGWAVGGEIMHFDGQSWSAVSNPASGMIGDVDMVSTTDGWAIELMGGILHYDGSSWQSFAAMPYGLASVEMVSSSDGWIGGDGVFLRYEGGQWTVAQEVPGEEVTSITMLSPTSGWAVGYGTEGDGRIWRLVNGTWLLVASPNETPLWDVDMLSSSEGWAVGNWSSIYHYDGSGWSLFSQPTWCPTGPEASLDAVEMVSATEGWASGACNGLLYYTTEPGRTLELRYPYALRLPWLCRDCNVFGNR